MNPQLKERSGLNGFEQKEEGSDRKKDHIQLAFQSQTTSRDKDNRFNYEPLMSGHPAGNQNPIGFLGKTMNAPLWISSMTGGTEQAQHINRNLAKACGEFGLGMGLGSCRKLLDDDAYFDDFNLRPLIGDAHPFFANLGIAQVEQIMENGAINKVRDMVSRLNTDGLIIHVNPLQEWMQPEGDKITKPPIEIITAFLDLVDFDVIVKEVGQGMGPKSLRALFQLPIAAIDFAAYGGTNFSKLELLRSKGTDKELFHNIAGIGHSAEEMVDLTNEILDVLGEQALCSEVIISGGISSFLEGYYLTNKVNCSNVYGQGAAFLKHAQSSYSELRKFVKAQIEGFRLAQSFLELKK